MYSVNIKKLEGRIKEKGYNRSTFAEALGINRDTLRAYLNNYEKIPYGIIDKMASVLECNGEEANAIFFALKLT